MLADAFPDLPSARSLQSEYERWWVKWQENKEKGKSISNFVDFLNEADVMLYPNIRIIFLISAVRPPSTAGNERSFSSLKRLKTYLRFTMVTDRLNGLSFMNIHQDIDIPSDVIIDKFSKLGLNRMAFL
ncbi:hypothetical protein HELRODRAFT_70153 [Helobdella robusta]|uniref:HAT C-terminal dimerisation domain-containing protein n=1 Tax=Helobdella robusta TaxID=6412 RepID=T1G030_HELRO|nr:hypothetical protein HELRODRAFT_70153 [Helobdella robusta]ESN91428.1 hypothetical protein HELRODRAFT_70153 [Helobdella robusta]